MLSALLCLPVQVEGMWRTQQSFMDWLPTAGLNRDLENLNDALYKLQHQCKAGGFLVVAR